MVHVIITVVTLSWSLASLVSFMIALAALMNPSWIVGQSQTLTQGNITLVFHASSGIYAKCGKPLGSNLLDGVTCTVIGLDGFATDPEVYPNTWKAAVFFIALGLTLMAASVALAVLSCCVQSVFKKSIFNVIGTVQAVAGMFYIVGIMLFPMGWSSPPVNRLCGRDASYFYPGHCSLGLGLWLAIGSTIVTLICGYLSIAADKSSSSDKVGDRINEGQTLICVS